MSTPLCLSIAGSDTSGGAGIQADLRTFHALGCYGLSTVTVVTAQTPTSVTETFPLPVDVIARQLSASLELQPVAVKTGLLFSTDITRTVTDALENFTGPVVTDPVMVAGCGNDLNESGMIQFLKRFIKERTTVLTPNLPEAMALIPEIINTDMPSLARALAERFDVDVLLKGGHAESDADRASDILIANGECYTLKAPVLTPKASHGTGCTMASAVAAGLARGDSLMDATINAKAFVWHSLANSTELSPSLSAMLPPAHWDVSMVDCRKC